ncbi:hypothetical protein ENBRE01_1865, partial [Enteropsectra breve]
MGNVIASLKNAIRNLAKYYTDLFSKTLGKGERAPYEVLGIAKEETLKGTKKAYLRLSYLSKDNEELLLSYNNAYEECKKKLYVEIYIPSLFDSDFKKYAEDFFERLAVVYQQKAAPGFLDPDYVGFYRYWGKFRDGDAKQENAIRSIIKYVKSKDPRNITSKDVMKNREDTMKKGAIKKRDDAMKKGAMKNRDDADSQKIRVKKEWKILCKNCDKGFNSRNTLNDHLKSRQHKRNIENGTERIEYLKD